MADQKELKEIKEHYNNALNAITDGNIKLACDVIHNKMGVKLYDLSLDIIDGLKDEEDSTKGVEDFIASKQLKCLIIKVNKALSTESQKEEEFQVNSINSRDEEWFADHGV